MTDPIGQKPRAAGTDTAMVSQLAAAMRAKLSQNRHKAHWSTVSNAWLLMRLAEEAAELQEALSAFRKGQVTAEDVIAECADVGAFAGMIADNVRHGRG